MASGGGDWVHAGQAVAHAGSMTICCPVTVVASSPNPSYATEIETRTPQFLKGQAEVARKRLAGLRPGGSQWLGPASWIQELSEAATEPLLETLGFQRPTTITRLSAALVATIRAGPQPVVLVLTPWGERLDASWRLGVTEAIRRSAKWCLLFNGTHIRIVNARWGPAAADAFWSSTSTSRWTTREPFAAFWGVVHASTFSPEANGETRLQAIVQASQRHSASVSQSLREGVIEASRRRGRRPAWFPRTPDGCLFGERRIQSRHSRSWRRSGRRGQ